MGSTPLELAGFCRMESIAAGEPVAGSAADSTSVIVALEHPEPWAARAIEASDLPDAVKATLEAWERDVPGVRPQLVRRDVPGRRRTLIVACTELGVTRAVRWALDDVHDLCALDLPDIVTALRSGRAIDGTEPVLRPQLLVCTNGKRDRCCAKWGLPLYRALASDDRVDVWRTTHLGGHRFAATLLWLPHGICYGRVELDEASALVDATLAARLHRLDRLRGRTCLDAPAQVAESAWRETTGITAVDALSSATTEPLDRDRWRVTLVDDAGHPTAFTITRQPSGLDASPSCGKPPAPVPLWRVTPGAPAP